MATATKHASITTLPAIYADLPREKLFPSPTNPRKTFKKDRLAELGESLKKGQLVPMLVRPAPKYGDEAYEIVDGERRWRASELAKLLTLRVEIRQMTDLEVLEAQLVSRAQSEDLHPVEEADGFRALSKLGLDVDAIAAKIGKSPSYVYARLKLSKLEKRPREAFLAGELGATIALLIARLPAEVQDVATREVLGDVSREDSEMLWFGGTNAMNPAEEGEVDYDPKAPGAKGYVPLEKRERQPLSFREASRLLQRKYMLRLEVAKFPTGDATLVPEAGACSTCEYRTGNQRELFSDVRSADVCTRPKCFNAKTEAAWKRAAGEAAKTGVRVIDDEAKASKYVDPEERPSHMIDLKPGVKLASFAQLLGKKALADIPKVLVRDKETGAPVEMIDRSKAVEKLRELGKAKKPPAPRKEDPAEEAKAAKVREDEDKQREVEDEARKRVATIALEKIAAAAELVGSANSGDKSLALWRWLARAVGVLVDSYDDGVILMRERHGIEDRSEEITKYTDKVKDVGELRGLVVEMLASASGLEEYLIRGEAKDWNYPGKGSAFADACKLFGVDLEREYKAALGAAGAAIKAEADATAAKKAKGKKGGKK